MNLADVLRRHGPAYLHQYGSRMPASHRQAVEAILRCHTAACGGSLYTCDQCGQQRFAYHRCGHRACGQCGHTHAEAWLEAQSRRLLPVTYFLLTFTILCMRQIAKLCRANAVPLRWAMSSPSR